MKKKFSFIKENGIFYTDEFLADEMIDLLNIDYKQEFTIIEPGVGEGHILAKIVERYLIENEERSTEEKLYFLEKNIVGFDIREDAIRKCIDKLNSIASIYIDKKINWNVKEIDVLQTDKLYEYFDTFDFVISNPPYVSRHNMKKETAIFLKEHSKFCKKFNYDLYFYFFEIGIKLWNKKGKIVYITPNSYLRAKSGETMMKDFIDNQLLEKIIDFEDVMRFESALTYTAITVLSTNNTYLTLENNKIKKSKQIPYENIKKNEIYSVYEHEFLNDQLDGYISLGEIAEIRNGLATLNDKVFIIKNTDIIGENKDYLHISKNNTLFFLEKKALKKVIRVSQSNEVKYCVFPYEQKDTGKYTNSKKIKRDSPNVYNYLMTQLDEEYKNKYGIYFGRTQGFTCYSDTKIVIPKVAFLDNNPFKIVGEGYIQSGLSIKLKTEYKYLNINLIQEYLNTYEVYNFLKIVSKNYASGYKSISSSDLNKIKIPKNILMR